MAALSSSNHNSNATGDFTNNSKTTGTTSTVGDKNHNNNSTKNKKEENGSSNTIIRAFPHLTITVYIPTVCVGVLIGKRGYTIDKIQRHAATESTKFYAVGSASGGSQSSQAPPSSLRGGNGNGRNNNNNNNTNNTNNTNANANNNSNNTNTNKSKQKKVSPDSVRISVVNYPPPSLTAQQHQQNYENYDNPHYLVKSEEYPASPGQQQQHMQQQQQQQQQQHLQQQQQQHHIGPVGISPPLLQSSMGDMGVPPTYTELDFSNPQWTPIVIRADPIAALHASKAIHEICCPEYIADRKQLIYIVDVPIPAVAGVNNSDNANIPNANSVNANASDSFNDSDNTVDNANLRHASIVGKKGNKLIQLSADHQCRIMVPPKQLGHNIIQLEAPLQECCSCLKAISVKLQADKNHPTNSRNNNDEKEGQQQQQSGSDATNAAAASQTQTKNARNRNKIENAKSNYQITLVVQPLPSQTKLRNIARKTETKILRKKIPKSQQKQKQKQLDQQRQEQEQLQQQQQQLDQDHLQLLPEELLELSLEDGEMDDEPEHQDPQHQEQGENSNTTADGSGDSSGRDAATTKSSGGSWRLTIVATTERKATKALDMLKVLVSKGYEVLVEEMGTTINDATTDANSSKAENPAARGDNNGAPTGSVTTSTGSELLDTPAGSAEDGSNAATASNNYYNNKSGGGRGVRGKKKKKYLYK